IGSRPLEAPAVGAAPRRAYRESSLFDRAATVVVVAREVDAVQRPGPARVSTEANASLAARSSPSCRRRSSEVRVGEAQPLLGEQPPPAPLRAEGLERAVDEVLLGDRAPAGL